MKDNAFDVVARLSADLATLRAYHQIEVARAGRWAGAACGLILGVGALLVFFGVRQQRLLEELADQLSSARSAPETKQASPCSLLATDYPVRAAQNHGGGWLGSVSLLCDPDAVLPTVPQCEVETVDEMASSRIELENRFAANFALALDPDLQLQMNRWRPWTQEV